MAVNQSPPAQTSDEQISIKELRELLHKFWMRNSYNARVPNPEEQAIIDYVIAPKGAKP